MTSLDLHARARTCSAMQACKKSLTVCGSQTWVSWWSQQVMKTRKTQVHCIAVKRITHVGVVSIPIPIQGRKHSYEHCQSGYDYSGTPFLPIHSHVYIQEVI